MEPRAARQEQAQLASTLTMLGIESSCDDTASAIVSCTDQSRPTILASINQDQASLHVAYGGVVPEIAARAHAERLDGCVAEVLARAKLDLAELDGVAVTAGPGLIGGLLAGLSFAKGVCAGAGLPLLGVNHLAGHALTVRLTDDVAFPYLALLASGGHCQFLAVRGASHFLRLGGTIDDAPGEAFDKCARILGFPQPGGPSIEGAARSGDPHRFAFPRPLAGRDGCDMSFSGLKTAVLHAHHQQTSADAGLARQVCNDIAASFQAAVSDVFAEKLAIAHHVFEQAIGHPPRVFALCGGVAANQQIRRALKTVCDRCGSTLIAPHPQLCTDNAAMIAWAGIERFRLGLRDDLSLIARPRWPLDATSAPMLGHGKKGARA